MAEDHDEESGRMNNRRRKFKQGIDSEDFRRQREDENVQIRKKEKDQELQKKRLQAARPQGEGDAGEAATWNELGDGNPGPTTADLPTLVAMVFQGTDENKLEGVKKIRQLLSIEKNPPITDVIDSGIVPVLIDLLKKEDMPDIQFE